MNYLVKKIDGHKISLIMAIATAIFSLVFYPFALMAIFADREFSNIFGTSLSIVFLLMPVLYFIFSYVFTRIFCGLFNVIMKKVNGFRVEIEEENQTSSSTNM